METLFRLKHTFQPHAAMMIITSTEPTLAPTTNAIFVCLSLVDMLSSVEDEVDVLLGSVVKGISLEVDLPATRFDGCVAFCFRVFVRVTLVFIEVMTVECPIGIATVFVEELRCVLPKGVFESVADGELKGFVDDPFPPCVVVGMKSAVEGNVDIFVVVGLNVLFVDDVGCVVVPTAFIE